MNYKQLGVLVAVALVLAVTISAGIIAFATVASAQDENSTQNETQQPVTSTTVQVIDENTRITNWSYADGQFVLLVEADRPTRMTITQAIDSRSSDSGTGTIIRRTLGSGTNRITVTTHGSTSNPALFITTPLSIENEEYTYVKADSPSSLIPQGPYGGSDVQAAGLGGAASVAVMVLFRGAQTKVSAYSGGNRLA